MQIVENKIEKNRSIFCWLPSLMTIKYPKGKALVLAWGFYTLVLKDTDNPPLDRTPRAAPVS